MKNKLLKYAKRIADMLDDEDLNELVELWDNDVHNELFHYVNCINYDRNRQSYETPDRAPTPAPIAKATALRDLINAKPEGGNPRVDEEAVSKPGLPAVRAFLCSDILEAMDAYVAGVGRPAAIPEPIFQAWRDAGHSNELKTRLFRRSRTQLKLCNPPRTAVLIDKEDLIVVHPDGALSTFKQAVKI